MAQFQRPAIGATLQPDKSYMLILGYRVRSGEMGRRTAIVIDYRSDGIRYTARFPAGLVICPAGLTDTACSFKYPAIPLD